MSAGVSDRVVWLDGSKTRTWFVWTTLDAPDGNEVAVIYRLSYVYAGQEPEVAEQRMVATHRLTDAGVTTAQAEVGDTVLKGGGTGEYLVLSTFSAESIDMAYLALKKRPDYQPGRRTARIQDLTVVQKATS